MNKTAKNSSKKNGIELCKDTDYKDIQLNFIKNYHRQTDILQTEKKSLQIYLS